MGITASEFHGTTAELNPDIRVPITASMALGYDPNRRSYELVARLKPGISLERALSESGALAEVNAREFAKLHPERSPDSFDPTKFMQIQPIARGVSVLRDQFGGALALLMAGVGLLLLMVCSNVAGLLLERATARERESALRLAIGASPARLMRQWLTETLLLAPTGGALGVMLARLAMPLLASMIPPLRNRVGDLLTLDPNLHLDWRAISFSFAACTLAAVIAGLAPSGRAARYDLSASLRTTRSSNRVDGCITVLRVALCTLLLVEAGLFARTVHRMRTMDIGFDAQHVVTFTLRSDKVKDWEPSSVWQQLRRAAAELPGVRSAAAGNRGLLRGTGFKATVGLPGTTPDKSEFPNASTNGVSPEYFDTMGMRLVAGRGFLPTDVTKANEVHPAIVNQAFVRRFFPNVDPIGQLFGNGSDDIIKPEERIIGVVTESQYRSLREPVPPVFYSHSSENGPILHVRTAGDPAALIAALRELIRKTAPGWTIREVNLLRDEEERSIWRERLMAQLAIAFATVAGLLAAIGLYRMLAYYVSRSKRGIGIRMAIGAARSDIVNLLVSRVAPLILTGAALGLTASLALSGWVGTLLFGIEPTDPVSISLAVALLILLAISASLLPAMRAMRIDPAITLRND